MSLTLTHSGTTVELAEDLYWPDEFPWAPVAQSATRTITGALIVQTAALTGGRPITLQPENDSASWMPRSVVEQLRAWAATPGLVMTLAGLRGVSRSVMFRHQDGPLDARPVVHFEDVDPGDFYLVTVRLMEVIT